MLLDRILDFPEQDVEHAMIPRSRVDVVRAGDSLAHVRELMSQGHSRYPVLGADEEILGVVHLQDVLRSSGADADAETLESIMRPAELVPTSMRLPDALRRLAASRNQLACVLDEYGGLAGVLTFEDLAEALVGEITDEHDEVEGAPAVVDDDGSWTMAGDVHVDEVERAVGRDLPRGDFETIGGLVISVHGELPEAGTSVVVLLPGDPGELALAGDPDPVWMRVEVLEIERHVPSSVRVTVPAEPPPDDDERSAALERSQEEER